MPCSYRIILSIAAASARSLSVTTLPALWVESQISTVFQTLVQRGLVVGFFRKQRYAGYEGKGFGEVVKLEAAVEGLSCWLQLSWFISGCN